MERIMKQELIKPKQLNKQKQPIYNRMALSKKQGYEHARKLGKKRIQRLFAEQGKYDSHLKSIGGYIIADC